MAERRGNRGTTTRERTTNQCEESNGDKSGAILLGLEVVRRKVMTPTLREPLA